MREFKRGDFVGSVEFVRSIVAPAEDMGHHPDIEISWDTVKVTMPQRTSPKSRTVKPGSPAMRERSRSPRPRTRSQIASRPGCAAWTTGTGPPTRVATISSACRCA